MGVLLVTMRRQREMKEGHGCTGLHTLARLHEVVKIPFHCNVLGYSTISWAHAPTLKHS